MKKVYISVDLEGLNGVTYNKQTHSSNVELFKNTQRQLRSELNAVIEGLLEGGVECVTVNDAHSYMDNLLISELSKKVELISGKPKPISMMNGLNSSFDCVFFLGYHAKAGSVGGVLAHTFSHSFKSVKLNNKFVGEAELNSIYAGQNNVPIAFASGDDFFCNQIKNDIGEIITTCTKTAVSFNSAVFKRNDVLLKELKENTIKALNNPESWILYEEKAPYSLIVDLNDSNKAYIANFLNCFNRVSSTEVEFNSDSFEEVYKAFQFLSATLG